MTCFKRSRAKAHLLDCWWVYLSHQSAVTSKWKIDHPFFFRTFFLSWTGTLRTVNAVSHFFTVAIIAFFSFYWIHNSCIILGTLIVIFLSIPSFFFLSICLKDFIYSLDYKRQLPQESIFISLTMCSVNSTLNGTIILYLSCNLYYPNISMWKRKF